MKTKQNNVSAGIGNEENESISSEKVMLNTSAS